MKVTQISPVHAANLVANSGNTAYGVGVIVICFVLLGHIQDTFLQKLLCFVVYVNSVNYVK